MDRIERAVIPVAGGAECRFHSVFCQLGAVWPLDRAVVDPAGVQLDELRDLQAQGRRAAGLPPRPHPRELWAVDRHERVPAAELAQREREAAEALAAALARNAAIEAELRGERRG
ncbi:hypothetical protein [Streptomyces sp. DI166]|uniref:hypothetical protein n=1 Tax=Streptomyces sp. DI166 TaxID=1839783 RepID=UPI000B8111D0|nr:hypothetical protein [Streptomyces sp. DI166]